MNAIMVDSILGPVDNIQEILPKEFAVVASWKEAGILEHLFLKEAGVGAVLIFNETDQAKVQQLLTGLPLSKYFEKIEYTFLDRQF